MQMLRPIHCFRGGCLDLHSFSEIGPEWLYKAFLEILGGEHSTSFCPLPHKQPQNRFQAPSPVHRQCSSSISDDENTVLTSVLNQHSGQAH